MLLRLRYSAAGIVRIYAFFFGELITLGIYRKRVNRIKKLYSLSVELQTPMRLDDVLSRSFYKDSYVTSVACVAWKKSQFSGHARDACSGVRANWYRLYSYYKNLFYKTRKKCNSNNFSNSFIFTLNNISYLLHKRIT